MGKSTVDSSIFHKLHDKRTPGENGIRIDVKVFIGRASGFKLINLNVYKPNRNPDFILVFFERNGDRKKINLLIFDGMGYIIHQYMKEPDRSIDYDLSLNYAYSEKPSFLRHFKRYKAVTWPVLFRTLPKLRPLIIRTYEGFS